MNTKTHINLSRRELNIKQREINKYLNILKDIDKYSFSNNSEDPFIQKCYLREKSLRINITKALLEIITHWEKPDFNGKLNHWQKNKVERNINNLKLYIEKLLKELKKEHIEEYCKNYNSLQPIFVEKDNLILLINSFYGSIIFDIIWASDISIGDLISIANGKVNLENLKKKLPSKVKLIKNTITPFLENNKKYKEFASTITEAIKCYKKNIYKGASILIIVSIEGLVRKLGEFLIKKQNIEKKEYYSLNNFLRNTKWKKDFEINSTELILITGDCIFKEDTPLDDKIVLIDLKTRLDFLRRRFKEDRDAILHGEKQFGFIWDLYINLSALYEVYLTIKYYEKLYKE